MSTFTRFLTKTEGRSPPLRYKIMKLDTTVKRPNNGPMAADVTTVMLEALRSGDHEVFSQIYLHYWDSLYRFIYRLIGSSEDAREFTQEIFIVLWKNRHRIDPGQGFKSYLYGIARNKVMDWFDHKQVVERFGRSGSPGNTQEYESDQTTIIQEIELITKLVVGQMPRTRREVFRMIVDNGLSVDDVARNLQISKAAVSTHLYHARQELRKFLMFLLFM